MFTDIEVSGATLLLCGTAERTTRIAQKYQQTTELTTAETFAQLEHLLSQTPPKAIPYALAVLCVESDQEATRWRQALSRARFRGLTVVDHEEPPQEVGTVHLIGAGPGDPGLMTRHALRALFESDLVLLDHLAPHQDLHRWAPRAEIIDVGKIPGKHTVPQREIDVLMVQHALAGKTVARLKGGDPYIFGRGAEEKHVCEQNGIPVRVYSGVTSSIALPALAGVPLTLRGVSHMFTVVSAHIPLAHSELDHIAELLKGGGTVSILMGVKTMQHTVTGLLSRGVTSDLPMITVQDGFRSHQRVIFSTLESAPSDLAEIKPPAVTTIGRVCALAGAQKNEILAQAFATH